MSAVHSALSNGEGLDPVIAGFYRGVLAALEDSGRPYLIGGAYALNHYASIKRNTRDLDIFIKREDFDAVSAALLRAGFEAELTFPHWLGKIHAHGVYIDLIFSSGNGVAVVDDAWFDHARTTELLGFEVKLSPIEEMIWSKAFIMERERYDGADIVHLLLTRAEEVDWTRLMQRFDGHWRVLLAHLVLFGFVYPAERHWVPVWVMDELLRRLRSELKQPAPVGTLCQGTLLSREQYLPDIQEQGLRDGRILPHGNMTQEEAKLWTRAIPDRG
ncbi:MAG TPA: nucleotidyltransferase [Noviherbaspirillum sp.]|nr:nucleotidyltransferase [Noviherbaspirillum sp.]